MNDRTDKPSDTLPAVDAASLPQPSPLRRRLLLGAGALPSVLTLSSGAMAAVGSTCVRPPARAPQQFTTHEDGWVRAIVREGDQGSMTAYCVSSRQSDCVDGFNADHAGDGSRWLVTGTGDRMTATDFSPVRLHNRRAYGLVYVDSEGTIATLDPTSHPGLSPVTQSCWTSLAARGMRLG
jgi:hypothetical protein